MTYPSYHVYSGGSYNPVSGPTHTYAYDAMARPWGLMENGSTTLATNA